MADEPTTTTMRPTISAAWADTIISAATSRAAAMSVAVTVVVVDESGVVKSMTRMDGAPLVSVQTGINKAYAAAAIGMPPDDFYSAIEADGAAVASFATRPGLALVAGGPAGGRRRTGSGRGRRGRGDDGRGGPFHRRGRRRGGHRVALRTAVTGPADARE